MSNLCELLLALSVALNLLLVLTIRKGTKQGKIVARRKRFMEKLRVAVEEGQKGMDLQ